MKNMKVMMMAGLLILASQAHAGVESFDSSEFNSIITDSMKNEKDLRTTLHENAGAKDTREQIAQEYKPEDGRVVGVVQGQEVVSPTSSLWHNQNDKSQKKMMDRQNNRVSEELDSLDHE